jgi:hypothetical protein
MGLNIFMTFTGFHLDLWKIDDIQLASTIGNHARLLHFNGNAMSRCRPLRIKRAAGESSGAAIWGGKSCGVPRSVSCCSPLGNYF